MPRIFDYDIFGGSDPLLGPVVLADNQVAPTAVIFYNQASVRFAQLQYSITRGAVTSTGRIMIACDGTTTTLDVISTDTAIPGITFTAALNAGVIELRYTSTNTGTAGSMKYYQKTWM